MPFLCCWSLGVAGFVELPLPSLWFLSRQTCECDAFTRSTELREGFYCYEAVPLEPGEFKKAECLWGKRFIAVGAEVYALFVLQCK